MIDFCQKINMRAIVVGEPRSMETMSMAFESVTPSQGIDLRAAEFFSHFPTRKFVRVSFTHKGRTYGPFIRYRKDVEHLLKEKQQWWQKWTD